jgi:hypothetical protein
MHVKRRATLVVAFTFRANFDLRVPKRKPATVCEPQRAFDRAAREELRHPRSLTWEEELANAIKIGIRSSCCNAQSWIIRVEQYERVLRTTPNKNKLISRRANTVQKCVGPCLGRLSV